MNNYSPTTDTDVIDSLVEAYNASDARAFANLFALEAKVFEHPNTLTQKNREEIYAYYLALFKKHPLNRTIVLHRIVLGNRIIDHERVQRHLEAATFDVVTMYEMEAGLIKRVDFIRQ